MTIKDSMIAFQISRVAAPANMGYTHLASWFIKFLCGLCLPGLKIQAGEKLYIFFAVIFYRKEPLKLRKAGPDICVRSRFTSTPLFAPD